jgi:hypothetical protein
MCGHFEPIDPAQRFSAVAKQSGAKVKERTAWAVAVVMAFGAGCGNSSGSETLEPPDTGSDAAVATAA